ncbi:MAG: threonylcarbamoyl-AMP synthase [Candidatus Diapherotrites archaeon]|uniref:L-threonylcarbamoyladenylate synthase n=1 Tax=Candidatus Iainarchaeum sp. TaxID=3101447 RepID=A0A2D6LP50_9ARCH|nr:threonylcarbamoyl-AMP synthase [Candidatus Diapherotrites archaeon]|tara:strand:+ start:7868 stop:8443 length:576 start_codon:yes stop_codon:yes gene_type:complete
MEIEKFVKEIRKGNIVAFPTETSYGLACDPFNEKAVRKLHELKKEPLDKPILLIVASKQMIDEIANLGENGLKLVEKFMPGPLTLIAKKRKSVPDFLSKEKVAFRISSNEIANKLSRKFGKPITGTSANLHEKKPAFSEKEVKKYFGEEILLIDAGKLQKSEASTIFDLEEKKIIREGPVSEKEIKKVLES